MNEDTTARVALVTGGGVRVGRVLSVGLAEAGYDVMIHYHSSRRSAEDTADEVRSRGRRALVVAGDLVDPSTADSLIAATAAGHGRLDLLVNSAAGFDTRPLLDADAEVFDEVMALNVRAPHLLVRAAAPMLHESRGCVVNITDLSAFQAWTEHPVHAVSKAALAHLTRVQARALAPSIRVNGIAPGAVLPPEDYAPERWEALRTRTPLQRLGSPADVLGAVLYLANADFVTGQIIAVDGGRLLGPSGPPSS